LERKVCQEVHSDLKGVTEDLRQLNLLIVELNKAFAVQAERCIGHNTTFTDLKAAVFGNGHDGLKTRVERLEQVNKDEEKHGKVTHQTGTVRIMIYAILASSLIGALGVIIKAIEAIIHH
jgi:hypothetical protein